MIGNQGPLGAFRKPLNLSGRVLPEKLLLMGNQGHRGWRINHFQQFNFIMSQFEVNLSPRTLNWDYIYRPKIWPLQTARGKNLGDMFFDVFQQAEQESEVKSQKK